VSFLTPRETGRVCKKSCFLDAKPSNGKTLFILRGNIMRAIMPAGYYVTTGGK